MASDGDGREVDVDAGLARLRRTHRHRNATRLAGAALAVACLVGVGALVLDGTDRTASPADQGPVDGPASPSIPESRSTRPLSTGSWQDYTSRLYDFTVGHPPNWTMCQRTATGPGSPTSRIS